MAMPTKVEVSHKTIIFSVLFLISLWFLFVIRDILLQLFIALLIMTILNPFVTKLSRWRIPRVVSVVLAYVIILGLFGAAIAGVLPPLIEQTGSFARTLPHYFETLGISGFVNDQVSKQFLSQIGALPQEVLKFGFSLFGNLLSVIAVLIFAFYLLLVRDKLDDQLASLFGQERQRKIAEVIDLLETHLGGWARGEIFLMALVGVANFIGLSLLGIPYALPLAILSGLLEIVPLIGPIVAAVPSVVIGLSISPVMGLATLALAFLVQQTENYVFVPKIMEKSINVSPIVTLLALAIGFQIMGVVGAIISVPVVITLRVLIEEHLLSK